MWTAVYLNCRWNCDMGENLHTAVKITQLLIYALNAILFSYSLLVKYRYRRFTDVYLWMDIDTLGTQLENTVTPKKYVPGTFGSFVYCIMSDT